MTDMIKQKILEVTGYPDCEKYYFLDISDPKQAALAFLFKDSGFNVRGLAKNNNNIVSLLKKRDINVDFYDKKIEGLIIDNEKENKKGTINKDDAICKIAKLYQSIGVAGSYGKTTVSSMISFVLEKNGAKPSYIIGGLPKQFDYNGKAQDGLHFVIELEDKKDLFEKYELNGIVITSIDNCDINLDKTLKKYKALVEKTDPYGFIVINNSCNNTKSIIGKDKKIVTFGIMDDQAEFCAKNISFDTNSSKFEIYHNGNSLGEFSTSIPGLNNVVNALSCIATCFYLGIDIESCRNSIKEFSGTDRSFEIKGEINNIVIVKDGAENPTDIKATLEIAKGVQRSRIVALYQPSINDEKFKKEISDAFAESDMVFVTEPYYNTNEKKMETKAVSKQIIEEIKKNGTEAEFLNYNPENSRETIRRLQDFLVAGDMLIVLGNGDIELICDRMLDFFKYKRYCATNM